MQFKVLGRLFHNPKGNGICRQVKRAEHDKALNSTLTAGSAIACGIIGSPAIPCAAAGAAGGMMLTKLINGKDFADAANTLNKLKATEEYKAVLDRAKQIKKVQG